MSTGASIFTVRLVTDDTSPELNVRTVGVSVDLVGTRSLLFQRALSFDQQDRDLKMDTYCVSNERGATAYGCITGYTLRPPWLDLHFTEAGAQDLRLDQRARLKLELSAESIETLRAGLKAVLAEVDEAGDG
jgi:hypothetical protein